MLQRVTRIELMDCSEIAESDHREYLAGVDFADYFAEEFVEGDLRQKYV